MAAPVRIEAAAFTDPRFEILGRLLGTDKYSALGVMAHIWSWATEREVHEIPISIASVFVGLDRSRVSHIVTAGLAELVPPPADAIRIRGSQGRLEWLGDLREMRRAGGKARAATAIRDKKGRLVSSSSSSKLDQQRGTSTASKHPAPSSALTPVLVLDPVLALPEERENTNGEKKQSLPSSKRTKATQLPDAWVPSRSEVNIAAETEAKARGIDLRAELLNLRDWAASTGTVGKDWDARWRLWIRRSKSITGSKQLRVVGRVEPSPPEAYDEDPLGTRARMGKETA